MPILYRFCLYLLCFLPLLSASAQDYSYIHYDTKDGLAGSTIYRICQDKDGFIWFGTEAGISRFDGSHFKNITTNDGLPESEIINVESDAKGRVWIIPFKNTICYYYQGKLHTSDNDPQLARLTLSSPVYHISCDVAGHSFFLLEDGNAIVSYSNDGDDSLRFEKPLMKFVSSVRPNFDKPGFIVSIEGGLYLFDKGQLSLWKKDYNKKFSQHLGYAIYKNQTIREWDQPYTIYTSTNVLLQGQQVMLTLFHNTTDGCYMRDSLDHTRVEDVFLKGKRVSYSMIDQEKNIWFATMGEGVYRLVSRQFRNNRMAGQETPEVISISHYKDSLYVGMRFGDVYTMADTASQQSLRQVYSNKDPLSRLVQLSSFGQDQFFLYDAIVGKRTATGILLKELEGPKYLSQKDSNTLLVATRRVALSLSAKDLSIKDTLWRFRTTAVTYYNQAYYIGTANGLYIVKKDKSVLSPGDDYKPLRFRTVAFARSADGQLWVATNGGGLVCLRGDKVIKHWGTGNGLSSNICRTLFLEGRYLWLGTDKGINKIDIASYSSPIVHFSTTDGLPSDIINAIYVDKHVVLVGTPAGLTSFNEEHIADHSRCDLRLLSISISDKAMPMKPFYRLAYRDNNLKIEFVGISFKSGGDILYRYRLKGLKDTWDSTRQNVLEYPSLPSGDYELEIAAVNKFGVKSNVLLLPFVIETPFWQSWWFNVLIVCLAISMTASLVAWRYGLLRRREQEKMNLNKRIHELEQMALRSQMNPHFIFNCLNSIQNFIINRDLVSSNQYLTEFAHLIRQTMDNAERGTLSLEKEISYLTRYIELKKMRFGHSFEYRIEVGAGIEKDLIRIPSMILQPYVENSIRHGIRHKVSGTGLVKIIFEKKPRTLLCIVEDNGIGRMDALKHKSQMHLEYQSKGMSLTEERLQALSRQFNEKVTVQVEDLVDAEMQPTGTRVVISFPLNLLQKLA